MRHSALLILLAFCISLNTFCEAFKSELLDGDEDWVIADRAEFKKTAETVGCHKGHCWKYCKNSLPAGHGEWCYTTKTSEKSGEYVKCTSNEECKLDWNCGGLCTY